MALNATQITAVRERFALTNKIDSLESYRTACNELNIRDNVGYYYDNVTYWQYFDITNLGITASDSNYVGRMGTSVSVERSWWAHREMFRMYSGVYPKRTDVMSHLIDSFQLQQFLIMCSPSEMNMVVYTPDADHGQRDKQVKTTFGRLFRKLLPLITDNQLRVLEEAHLSELDPSFPIAYDIDMVEEIYRNMRGDSGCMRHDPSEYGLPSNVHPSHVYTANGLGVAYLKTSSGDIKARSVVYVNPDNPEDKRYVRIYGDGKLATKLERAGYRMADLNGAKLPIIQTDEMRQESDEHHISCVVPYLDGPGGSQSHPDGIHGYVPKGKDYIQLVTANMYNKITRAMAITMPKFKSTSVKWSVPVIDTNEMGFTCALSGVFYGLESNEEGRHIVVFAEDGSWSIKRAANQAASGAGYTISLYVSNPERSYNRVIAHITSADIAKHCTTVGYDNVIKGDTHELVRRGFRLLSTKYYDANTVVSKDECVCIDADNNVHIRSVDAYRVIEGSELDQFTCRIVHKSEVTAIKQSRLYASIGRIDGIKTWCIKSHPGLVETASGTTALRGYQNIVQLWDERYEFERNARYCDLFGASFYYLKTEGIPRLQSIERFKGHFYSFSEAANSFVANCDKYIADRVRMGDSRKNAVETYLNARYEQAQTNLRQRLGRITGSLPINGKYIGFNPETRHIAMSEYSGVTSFSPDMIDKFTSHVDNMNDDELKVNYGDRAVLLRNASLVFKHLVGEFRAAESKLTNYKASLLAAPVAQVAEEVAA